MKPLAYRMRPVSLHDVVDQDHLVSADGVISKMIEQGKLFSFILYGPPGTGKTTIAEIVAKTFGFHHYFFNASTDNKNKLKDIVSTTVSAEVLLIIDEIHRMKTDIQDFLLPFMESGQVIVIGLTTVNPYVSVNPAIRSRCHVYGLNPISQEGIQSVILKALNEDYLDKTFSLSHDTLEYLSVAANGEIRTALNMLESISLVAKEGERVLLGLAKRVVMKPSLSLDKSGDNYYDMLSALQKSIRGSDVDAALHYLARLITAEDLTSIIRRLLVIAYEDIGLANPGIGPKVVAACEAAKQVGFPEARIPLSVIVVDMALSPKSNSTYTALDQALSDFQSGKAGPVPKHLKQSELMKDPNLYLYPHNYKGAYVVQQYLPDNLKDVIYYEAKDTGSYERALAERNETIKQLQRKKR